MQAYTTSCTRLHHALAESYRISVRRHLLRPATDRLRSATGTGASLQNRAHPLAPS
jgi:hypothetical protein